MILPEWDSNARDSVDCSLDGFTQGSSSARCRTGGFGVALEHLRVCRHAHEGELLRVEGVGEHVDDANEVARGEHVGQHREWRPHGHEDVEHIDYQQREELHAGVKLEDEPDREILRSGE
jgi:hypothetical protein